MKLTPQEHKELEQVNENVCKILIYSMEHFKLEEHITSTVMSDGYIYELKFTKEKI